MATAKELNESAQTQKRRYLEDLYEEERDRRSWQFPEDTPAKHTNQLKHGASPGDFMVLGGQGVVRPLYEAYEYARLEYERPDRRRLSYWTDASCSHVHPDSSKPENREWRWHATAVVGREDFCATGSLDWTHDTGLYRPRPQKSEVMEFRALDAALGRAMQKLQRDHIALGGRRAGWDTFAAFTDNMHNINIIAHFRRRDREHMAKPYAPVILSIFAKVRFLVLHGVGVQLHWVPAHVGIEGNHLADTKARETAWFGQEWAAADRSVAWIQSRADGSEPTAVMLV
ncbi:hypothetical protein DBV05_g10272 [Lasiodiplodia theobromae]|uniref:RNase H type-1 domain-containing protein n=1 Tax=Lasiodiplodia theobromae TaxID=45133 RepID=A0A5N5D0B8_9PEZI|nr:hypothetical protein DBV05_g10272 [Lasiodiplodia theobromae]